MADYAGEVIDNYYVESTYAMTAPRFAEPRTGEYASLLSLGEEFGGTYAAGGVTHSSPVGTSNYAAVVAEEASTGFDWFNKVHFLDRQVYDFGLILSQKTDDYEVFNAWRQDITFTALVNNIGSSVTLPSLPTPPVTFAAFTSFLDPSSTHASGANKNKTRLNFVVSKDGPPTFNNTIEWDFSTGDVASARLRGLRVSVIPGTYEYPLSEKWTFPSDSIFSRDGTEQVLTLTKNPIQSFDIDYVFDAEERQRMQALLMGGQTLLLALPVWHEEITTTAALTAGATSASVRATTDVDFRVGGLAVIYESGVKYDVVQLSSVATNSLGFSSTPIQNNYGSNSRVVPLRLGYIISDVSSARMPVRVESFSLQFQVTDNDTGMFAPSTTGWSTYGSKVLLDDPNIVSGEMDQTFAQEIRIIDNSTGAIEVVKNWAINQGNYSKGFYISSRAEMMKLKKLLLALRGRQVSFRIPTFIEDLTVVANLGTGASTMDISHIGYTRYIQSREPKKVFRITFTDGTSLNRSISSSVEVSSTVERLTLDTTWPANRTVAEISRVEFLVPARFASETFTFKYDRTGRASLTAPIRTLLT